MEWHERELLRSEAKRTRDEINRQTTYLAQNQRLEAAKSRLADAKLALELEKDRVKKARLTKLVKEYETEVNQLTAALHPEGGGKMGCLGCLITVFLLGCLITVFLLGCLIVGFLLAPFPTVVLLMILILVAQI